MSTREEKIEKQQAEYIAAVNRGRSDLTHLSTGLCAGCETCKDEYGLKVACLCKHSGNHPDCADHLCLATECDSCAHDCELCLGDGDREPTEKDFAEQVSSGEVYSEPFFSWIGCDICGSGLGGNFEPWHCVNADGEIVHGERACVDCVQYLANGTLPGDEE